MFTWVYQTRFIEHRLYCTHFDFQKVEYPQEGKNDTVEFKNFHKQLRIPFVIYADFETSNKKLDPKEINESSYTHMVEFEACGFSFQVVCSNNKYTKNPVV